jgi:hypothetical protein
MRYHLYTDETFTSRLRGTYIHVPAADAKAQYALTAHTLADGDKLTLEEPRNVAAPLKSDALTVRGWKVEGFGSGGSGGPCP